MAIPLPNLDDRRFADLVAEMRALIPRYAPAWTDHNVSDPGITLLDLFAWLAEALMYRLNRITPASEARFLELLGVEFHPARPATVPLAVRGSGLTAPLLIPRGTPLRSPADGSQEALGFETVRDLPLVPASPEGTVEARQSVTVVNESLGFSSGEAYQLFPIRQPFVLLEPTMLPRVTVGGEVWTYVANLLDSRATDRHYTLEPRSNSLRFGNGRLGRVPPGGAEIVASYSATRGGAGNLPAGTPLHLDTQSGTLPAALVEALRGGVTISWISRAIEATGEGRDPTSLDDARQQALRSLRERWRAVTARDFEEVVLGQAEFPLARAKCVPERDLSAPDPDTPRPGHVSVVIVPSVPTEQPGATHMAALADLLNRRRLITCRHHVVGVRWTWLRVRARIVRAPQVSEETVRGATLMKLAAFFDPLTGGPDPAGGGWPFGRDVHISEVYQVLEGAEGVDHIESLTLSFGDGATWVDAEEHIAVPPDNLVHFDARASELIILSELRG